MEKKELQNLAQKIQIELEEQEVENYLENFENLEKSLIDFKSTQIEKTIKPVKRIDVGYLKLNNLKNLEEGFFHPRTTIKNQKANSSITSDEFVLFKK